MVRKLVRFSLVLSIHQYFTSCRCPELPLTYLLFFCVRYAAARWWLTWPEVPLTLSILSLSSSSETRPFFSQHLGIILPVKVTSKSWGTPPWSAHALVSWSLSERCAPLPLINTYRIMHSDVSRYRRPPDSMAKISHPKSVCLIFNKHRHCSFRHEFLFPLEPPSLGQLGTECAFVYTVSSNSASLSFDAPQPQGSCSRDGVWLIRNFLAR